MKSGKKEVATAIVYGALDQVQATLLQKQKAADAFNEKKEEKGEEGEGKGVKGKLVQAKNISALSRTHTLKDSPELRAFTLKKFEDVLGNVTPSVEVRSRRVGGATYQVPVEVRSKRGMALAMRWLISNAKSRAEKNMASRLASEILDALEGRGGAVKRKDNMHKMAKANQAFAHYGW